MAFALTKNNLGWFFGFRDVLGHFWQNLIFEPFFGSKNSKFKIYLAAKVFELKSCPSSMFWTWHSIGRSKKTKKFWKSWFLWIYAHFAHFQSGEEISKNTHFYSQFFLKIIKYRSREGFMEIFKEVFFRRPYELFSAKLSAQAP